MITKEFLVEKFNEFIKDELSAAAGYHLIANKLKNKEAKNVITELEEHGKEEFQHFTELVAYAAQHGFVNDLNLTLDYNVINYIPSNVNDCVKFIQKLETEAREDYREMAQIAEQEGAIELGAFFTELMQDEIKHFSDLDYFFGDTRSVTETLLVEKLLR